MKRKKEVRWVFELIKNSDLVLEVVDGRFPQITRVSSIEKQISDEGIPLIIVLNKCDLVPREICEKNKQILQQEYPTVYISAQIRQGTKKLRQKIARLSPKRETIISLVGIPNTGKSSILNILRGKHVARTGQKPGVTRHKQVVRISKKLLIYDTPGVVPFDHPDVYLQAFLGAYPIENLEDPIDTAEFFLNRIKNNHSEGLRDKFDLLSIEQDNHEILTHIARKRGLILKGGKLNYPEAAKVLMREFVAGKIPYWEEITEVNTKESSSNSE